MDNDIYLRWARMAACGALVGSSIAGLFGFNDLGHDGLAAIVGGASAAILVKALHIV